MTYWKKGKRKMRKALTVVVILICAGMARAQYTETILHVFASAGGPSPLFRDRSGNLFGTIDSSGGEFYELPAGPPPRRIRVLFDFLNKFKAQNPAWRLKQDLAGNFYGVTEAGGPGKNANGIVYKVSASPNFSPTLLHVFNCPTGALGCGPTSPLARDPATGDLYGSASGGMDGAGILYKLATSGTLTVVYSFTGGANGNGPSGDFVIDSAWNFYGTAGGGDAVACPPFTGFPLTSGCGIAYKVDATATETILHTFTGPDGANPNGLVTDAAGNLYGSAFLGGDGTAACPGGTFQRPGCGVVFKIDTLGTFSVLHSFTGGSDGSFPNSVIVDPAGNVYGSTREGGLSTCQSGAGCGTAYKIDSSGNFSVVFTFTGGSVGASPTTLTLDRGSGNLFGVDTNLDTSRLQVFRLSPP
jgi:uncharacterized repeat protein (TIGR03803 family)